MKDKNTIYNSKRASQSVAFWIFRFFSFLVVAILVTILSFIIYKGAGAISWDFITKMPEDGMTKGGILPAIVGTLCLVAGSIIFAFPIRIS